jgi:hypothetical protein
MSSIGAPRSQRTRRRAYRIPKPEHVEVPARPPEPAPCPVADSPVVALQRAVGNRGMGQVVAREAATKPAATRQTGIRSSRAIERFAHKAVGFFRRNGDLPLKYFAIYLGAAVNEELAAIGCPAVHVTISQGALGAAAEFNASGWEMALNPAEFSHRPEVEKLGDLTPDEAAIIAMTV